MRRDCSNREVQCLSQAAMATELSHRAVVAEPRLNPGWEPHPIALLQKSALEHIVLKHCSFVGCLSVSRSGPPGPAIWCWGVNANSSPGPPATLILTATTLHYHTTAVLGIAQTILTTKFFTHFLQLVSLSVCLDRFRLFYRKLWG